MEYGIGVRGSRAAGGPGPAGAAPDADADADETRSNVAAYRPRDFELFRAESVIFGRFLRPGMLVLDLGTGNGRVASRLALRGIGILACDLNLDALAEFQAARASAGNGERVEIFGGDARALPLRDGSVDAVVFAYNGLDMIGSMSGRVDALAEIHRVLRPGGVFVASSHNPIGTILSPRATRSRQLWRFRLRHLRTGAVLHPMFDDVDGARIHQASPGTFIRQVRRVTGLEPVGVWSTRSGLRGRAAATLFSAWPTYVFRKPAAG
ncbi:MAG: class I SAM-dependent methyltransferase [Actinomycetota bacterium]|nr:class I SAM-dependent methyltransferase [Actinomycetota bacterium]